MTGRETAQRDAEVPASPASETAVCRKYRELTYRAAEADDGRTVRQVLKEDFGLVDHDISRAKYRKDGIRVNGRRTYVTTALRAGDLLEIRIDDAPAKEIVYGDGDVTVLYEDEDLLAVDKPAGVVVHPSHGHYRDSLGSAVAGYFHRRGEERDIRTIGRLDKETSGLMLYAKTRSAVYLMNRQREGGFFKKTYLALVSGQVGNRSFDGPIGRVPGEKLKREVRPDGDPALTFCETVRYDPTSDISLIRCTIKTGRTHQIRVHLSDAGHPLIGDALYGGRMDTEIKRAALHSAEARFLKLFTGEEMMVTSPLPKDMEALIARWT